MASDIKASKIVHDCTFMHGIALSGLFLLLRVIERDCGAVELLELAHDLGARSIQHLFEHVKFFISQIAELRCYARHLDGAASITRQYSNNGAVARA